MDMRIFPRGGMAVAMLLGFALVPAEASHAQARNVELPVPWSTTPSNLRQALEAAGIQTRDISAGAGTLVLESADGRTVVSLYDCVPDGCSGLHLRISFAYPTATMALANRWNEQRLYGRAVYMGDGRIYLDLVHYLPDRRITGQRVHEIVRQLSAVSADGAQFFAQ